jgi:hypothetical protein
MTGAALSKPTKSSKRFPPLMIPPLQAFSLSSNKPEFLLTGFFMGFPMPTLPKNMKFPSRMPEKDTAMQ